MAEREAHSGATRFNCALVTILASQRESALSLCGKLHCKRQVNCVANCTLTKHVSPTDYAQYLAGEVDVLNLLVH